MGRRIVALGGGGFAMEPRNPRMDRWILSLTGKKRPRVLFLPTASGDSADFIKRFYKAFKDHPSVPSHLSLVQRTGEDLRERLLSQDVIYAGGGNTANMLAIWRVHGVDVILREAWESGIVLCGPSAGAICWFRAGLTDSFGPKLQPLHGCLGFLPGSFCPHYDEPERRPLFRQAVSTGHLPPGLAADNGAAILFEEALVADITTTRKSAQAWRVSALGEQGIRARLL